MKKYRYWLFILIILYSAWAVSSVSAHALLVRSTPAANAVLAQPPVQVEIFFSEPLEEQLSSIRVFDSNNLSVDAGDVRVDPADPTRLTVTLHSITDGVYTVTWKVVSSIDGHQTTGSFPFAVGSANADAVSAIQQRSTFRLPFSTLLSKFLMLVSLAVLLGHRLFIALVWEPAVRANPSVAKPPVWEIFYRLGLIGVLVCIGIGILAQGGQSTGSELAAPWNPQLGRILTETRLGVIWLARLALAMLAVWLAGRKESQWRDWGSFAVNLALLFTVTLTSHAATEPRPLLPMLGDWLHLVGMGFWLGGLVYFFTAIRQLQQLDERLRTQLTSLLAGRFSLNAILFVGLIGLTGFYSAYLRVGSWNGLITSLYGHTLLVKQAFVAGLLVIAATNLLVISPQLKRDRLQGITSANVVARFGKLLIFELIFAGLLLASVSFLTYIPPAKLAGPTSDLTGKTEVDDLSVGMTISPGRIGQNTFTLRLSSNGEPVRTANEVLLRFTPDQANIPPSDLELISQGDGTFNAKGTYLSVPGIWQIQAIVRREDKFDAYANFNFTLQKPGAPSDGAANAARQSGLLLLLAGLLCGLIALAVKARPALRLGASAPLTVLMLGLGIFFLSRPAPANIERINPIPLNAESIATGQALFSTNCAACHGQTGKGDGPVGVTLNPRPADLTQHAIVGIHTDAQLFEWITNGFPGSRMPAFKSALSDTERWHLVNFIRSLAPK
ncbi:MAG TPA: copper resistance protein CopC, partial [Anaerolineales bacterium]|nr:copper resistance protein CopC [Anaerolineales bacterium]